MKKRPKIIFTSIAVITVLVLFKEYITYKLKEEPKEGNIIDSTIEELNYNDIFTPIDSDFNIKLPKPEVKLSK